MTTKCDTMIICNAKYKTANYRFATKNYSYATDTTSSIYATTIVNIIIRGVLARGWSVLSRGVKPKLRLEVGALSTTIDGKATATQSYSKYRMNYTGLRGINFIVLGKTCVGGASTLKLQAMQTTVVGVSGYATGGRALVSSCKMLARSLASYIRLTELIMTVITSRQMLDGLLKVSKQKTREYAQTISQDIRALVTTSQEISGGRLLAGVKAGSSLVISQISKTLSTPETPIIPERYDPIHRLVEFS